jgi:DivIVA domain-containing protein
VGTVFGYIVALVVVGGLLFLAASFAFGRGEEMAPALPDGTPLELPDDRLADGSDLRALRLSVAVRGYRMDEVDWLLDKLSEQVDTRDREIARLRSVLHVEPVPLPDGEPAVRDASAAAPAPDPDAPFDQEADQPPVSYGATRADQSGPRTDPGEPR